ncbi:tetratricopeptide repeat protein, partial [Myxococcota bacterium]|nr:tetratricopeptide repeat protein [Myxococcota bacterium]MBU1534941.1 tetratricopeptide repeat protein [Myxococcota bacterium]
MRTSDQSSIVWNTIPQEEKKAFVLLAVPLWFNENLGKKLLESFSAGPPSLLEQVIRHDHVVFPCEDRGWYLAEESRGFLAEKCGEFGLCLPSVHNLLIEHFQAAKEKGGRLCRKEYGYLCLYHQIQADVPGGLRAIFTDYLATPEQDRPLRLPALVRVCETTPCKVGSEPEYRVLKIMQMLLQDSCHQADLERFRDELKIVARANDDAVLVREANRLLIAVLDRMPRSKSNMRLRKKVEKRLERDRVDSCLQGEPEQPVSNKDSSAFFAKHVSTIVARIVNLHRQGRHEEAWDEATGYLVNVQGSQKPYLCKSYCNIASSICDVPDSVEWQLQYFDLAAKANRFDTVVLNGKAMLLSRLGRAAEAEELFDKAYVIAPHDVVSLNSKAELLSRLGRVVEAEALFDKAHAIDPSNKVALNGKAGLLSRLGRLEEA